MKEDKLIEQANNRALTDFYNLQYLQLGYYLSPDQIAIIMKIFEVMEKKNV